MRTSISTSGARRRQGGAELDLAIFTITLLAAVYVTYDLLGEPAGSHPFGHWLGIIGTLLMVMTESLYSLRKRTRLFSWGGPVRRWLSFHIFTGLVGPFLVLMHTGLHFRGLAGVTLALTMVVVVSGFVGRYLYTGVQRSVRGTAGDLNGVLLRIESQRGQLENLFENRAVRFLALENMSTSRYATWPAPARAVARSTWLWRQKRGVYRESRQVERRLTELLKQRRQLQSAMARAATLRRLFVVWHLVHVPLGITLFVSVGIHIAATVYFRAGIFAP